MSVMMMVTEPKTAEYSRLQVPIATEEMFSRIWQAGAKVIEAKWLPLFQTGIDFGSEEFVEVASELSSFRTWVENERIEDREYVLSRVDLLQQTMRTLFVNEKCAVKVWIG